EMQRPGDGERSVALDVGQRWVGGEADDAALVGIADMIAADGAMDERVAIVVGGAKTNGDPWQPRHRLDHPDELRRAKKAAGFAKTRGKSRGADRAALAIGKNGRYYGGVAKIFRLEIGNIVEHDVGEPFLLIAGKEAGEDGIAVESRVTPPHQPRGGIHERSRAPVADDGKIKPVIDHGV